MPDMVTRCPQCSTSFRITPSQLKSAKGAVRCGSCLHIFKALDNLVNHSGQHIEPPVITQEAPEPEPVATDHSVHNGPNNSPSDSTDDTISEPFPETDIDDPSLEQEPEHDPYGRFTETHELDDFLDNSQIDETPIDDSATLHEARAEEDSPVEEGTEEESAASINADSETELEQTALDQPDSANEETTHSETLTFDQASINAEAGIETDDDDDLLISDDMDDIQDTQVTSSLGNFSTSFLETNSDNRSLFDREIKVSNNEEIQHSDESWAVNLLVDEEHEEETASESSDDEEAIVSADSEQTRNPKAPSFQLVNDDEDSEEVEEEEDLSQGLDAYPELSSLLSAIQPEPVEMSWDNGERRWPQKLIWSLLSLLCLVALVAQVAWFQFDQLSRTQPYRSWYATACPILGCKLTKLVDRSRIRAYNLVIRSHPRTENALIVDAILLNSAPFSQAFPELVLSFSDLSDTLVSYRSFTAKEYLAGELAGRTQMPSNQPIHFSLEIVDPGEDAVNYSVFIPN